MTAARTVPRATERIQKAEAIARILGLFLSVQMVIQAIGMLVGLVVVNWLTKTEYAMFTLGVTFSAAIGVMANSGFTSALLSIGARVRHDRAELSELVASALAFRRRVTLLIMIPAAPTLFALLLRNGASISQAALIAFCVFSTTGISMTTAVYNDVLSLEYQRSDMQRIALVSALFRLVGTSLLLAVPTALASLPLGVNMGGLWLTRRLQTRPVRRFVDATQPASVPQVAEIRHSFFALLPANTVLVFQGQIVIIALAASGQKYTLAEIGALSRFSMIFALIGATAAAVIAPMLARTAANQVIARYAIICGVLLLLLGLILTVAFAAAKPLLSVLGSEYRGLEVELRIVLAAAAISCVADVTSSLNQCRGWIQGAWMQLPLTIGAAIWVALGVSLQQPAQAAMAMVILAIPSVLTQGLQFVIGIRSGSADLPKTADNQEA